MNWGKGITIGIVLFMLFILSFVYKAFQYDIDLVVDDYYEQESNYEKNIESKNNYNLFEGRISVNKEENGICFSFPEDISKNSPGSIYFYRPDSKKLDRTFDLEIDQQHKQCITYENFYEGYYDITVKWNAQDKDFIFEDNIQF